MVAAPDDERGSVVRAVVVLRDGYAPSDALARELQDHVKGQTAPYKYPRIVDFAADLPKTPSGKVRRAALRQSARSRSTRSTGNARSGGRRLGQRQPSPRSAAPRTRSSPARRAPGRGSRAAPAPRSAARARAVGSSRGVWVAKSCRTSAVALREAEAAAAAPGRARAAARRAAASPPCAPSPPASAGRAAGSSSSHVIATAGGSGRGSSRAASASPGADRVDAQHLARPSPAARATSAASARSSRPSPASASTCSSRIASASSSSALRWCRPSPSASQSASSRSSGRSRSPSVAAAAGERERGAVDAAAREEAPAGDGVARQRLDHEVAPARMHPVDPHADHPQEVVGEPVDEVDRRLRQPARRVAAQRGREVALGDRPGRRVEHRQQQLAVLGLERVVGGGHRRRSARLSSASIAARDVALGHAAAPRSGGSARA